MQQCGALPRPVVHAEVRHLPPLLVLLILPAAAEAHTVGGCGGGGDALADVLLQCCNVIGFHCHEAILNRNHRYRSLRTKLIEK